MLRQYCGDAPHWCMNCVVRNAIQCNRGKTEVQVELEREEVRKRVGLRENVTNGGQNE